jgi:hypothetical protein
VQLRERAVEPIKNDVDICTCARVPPFRVCPSFDADLARSAWGGRSSNAKRSSARFSTLTNSSHTPFRMQHARGPREPAAQS